MCDVLQMSHVNESLHAAELASVASTKPPKKKRDRSKQTAKRKLANAALESGPGLLNTIVFTVCFAMVSQMRAGNYAKKISALEAQINSRAHQRKEDLILDVGRGGFMSRPARIAPRPPALSFNRPPKKVPSDDNITLI